MTAMPWNSNKSELTTMGKKAPIIADVPTWKKISWLEKPQVTPHEERGYNIYYKNHKNQVHQSLWVIRRIPCTSGTFPNLVMLGAGSRLVDADFDFY